MKNAISKGSVLLLLAGTLVVSSYTRVDKCCTIQTVPIQQGDIIGRKVIMPDTFERYTPFKNDATLTSKVQAQVMSPLKIYAFVNVSCPSCIVDIANWQSFISDTLKNEVPVIMVCTSKDRFEYFKYLCEGDQIKHFTFPLYLDTKNQYVTRNPFVTENLAYQTVLTNADNTILVSGDPLHSESVRKLYLDQIKKSGRAVPD